MPSPVRGELLFRNSNLPFWLLVLPGIGCTLIWSKSSSPEYSMLTPPFKVCRSLTHVVVLANVRIGPSDDDGYGPPSISPRLSMEIVGILSGISLLAGNK